MKKYLLCGVLGLLLVVLLSPIVSLFLPDKLFRHTYRHVGYKVLALNKTQGLVTDEKKTIELMSYIHRNLSAFANQILHSGKPFSQLRDGAAWCDYQSNIFGAILAKVGIAGRYVFLLNKDGVSNHTVAEVLLDGKWRFFDPFWGLYFRKSDGSLATLQEVSGTPSLLYEHPRALKLKAINKELYEGFKSGYERLIPIPRQPETVSIPKLYNQQHLFNKISDFYVEHFGPIFYKPYLECFLWRYSYSKEFKDKKDYWLFYKARSYQLYGLKEKAEKAFDELENVYPDSLYTQEGLYYKGRLYWAEFKDKEKTIQTLTHLLSHYPNTSWKKVAHNLIGLAYEEEKNIDLAVQHYKEGELSLEGVAVDRLYDLTHAPHS